MEIGMETITTDSRMRELHDLGVGFIYNDFAGATRTASSKAFNKLHRASCPECDPRRDRHAMTVNTSGQKIWFASMQDAAGWLMEHRVSNYTRCSGCNPA